MSEVVLDASALLAWLRGEEGADVVETQLDGARISAVNLAEVGSVLTAAGMPAEEAREVLDAIRLVVCPFDEALAHEVARLKALTRKARLSLGDRACLALAARDGVPALTADPSWAALNVGIAIELIRGPGA
jgi:PIN domain nuclease of toxin-antitoxin system